MKLCRGIKNKIIFGVNAVHSIKYRSIEGSFLKMNLVKKKINRELQ